MKLHLTATSERGKPVTKSGNISIVMELKGANRLIDYTVIYTPFGLTIEDRTGIVFDDREDTEPKTAREEKMSLGEGLNHFNADMQNWIE